MEVSDQATGSTQSFSWAYELEWRSHKITRQGYLVFGAPNHKITRQGYLVFGAPNRATTALSTTDDGFLHFLWTRQISL
ncbi:MAG: hypothetical protein B6247_31520 [Candidatus Parabeggiatoa sp. nov. 2]|nr:MAG: hypothetical protein B6247_31520 [Beggiatoa sp. 4572_84]